MHTFASAALDPTSCVIRSRDNHTFASTRERADRPSSRLLIEAKQQHNTIRCKRPASRRKRRALFSIDQQQPSQLIWRWPCGKEIQRPSPHIRSVTEVRKALHTRARSPVGRCEGYQQSHHPRLGVTPGNLGDEYSEGQREQTGDNRSSQQHLRVASPHHHDSSFVLLLIPGRERALPN